MQGTSGMDLWIICFGMKHLSTQKAMPESPSTIFVTTVLNSFSFFMTLSILVVLFVIVSNIFLMQGHRWKWWVPLAVDCSYAVMNCHGVNWHPSTWLSVDSWGRLINWLTWRQLRSNSESVSPATDSALEDWTLMAQTLIRLPTLVTLLFFIQSYLDSDILLRRHTHRHIHAHNVSSVTIQH